MNRQQSIREFQSTVREHYRFLITDYGFNELPETPHHELGYESERVGINVNGIHWGEGCDVLIRPTKQAPESLFVAVPLWAIVKISYPDKYAAFRSVVGQIPQAKASAAFLKDVLSSLLAGDVSQLTEPRRYLEKRHEAVTSGTWKG